MKLQNKTFFLVSLGCSKNLVDSEVMLGYLNLNGFKIVDDPAKAGIIIVNTCSFIESAKTESIETILEYTDYKNPQNGVCQLLVVAGCMAQRYAKDLEQELPEVDLFIGTGEYNKIITLIQSFEEENLDKKSYVDIPTFIHTDLDPRMNSAPSYMAWLKISEGCNRKCTFCIIPKIRGELRSRTVSSLVAEAQKLAQSGVRELNIISQDLSQYGKDLQSTSNGQENSIINLLKALDQIEGLHWVRLFYYYPDEMDDEVVEFISKSSKICAYLDMPIQHFSDRVLKRMNRHITKDLIFKRLDLLRAKIPSIIIRTSVIVGFPGETEEDFNELLEGVKKAKFHHLGVFKYSDEEGTAAFRMDESEKLDAKTIEKRFKKVYDTQRKISTALNKEFLGKTIDVLVEGTHDETELLIQGRYYGQAPDIDGKVIINDTNDSEIKAGDILKVKINEVLEYDLVGEVVVP